MMHITKLRCHHIFALHLADLKLIKQHQTWSHEQSEHQVKTIATVHKNVTIKMFDCGEQ